MVQNQNTLSSFHFSRVVTTNNNLFSRKLNSLLQQFYRMYFTRNIFRSPEPGADHQHCVCGPVRHPLRARLLPGGGRLVPRGPQTVPGCQALLW